MADTKGDLWEHAACGLLLTSADGTLRAVNTTFCIWTGYRAQDLCGKRRIQDLLTVGGKIFHQTHWAPLLQMQGSVAEVKLDIVTASGERLPMLMNAMRHRHGDEFVNEFAVMIVKERHLYEKELLAARRSAEDALVARSVAESQLHAVNAELLAADRRKDEFLAILAHELRNPLAPIRNALEVLNEIRFPDPVATHMQQIITRQVRHMTRLVDDLLDVARINRGHVEIVRTPIDFREIVADAVETVQPIFSAKGVTLLSSAPTQPLPVSGDAARLVQVVGNLLNNAMKFTDAGGTVAATLVRQDNEAVLTVKDTGIGIAAEDLPRLFEMFVQVDSSVTRSHGGLGIGLMLVKFIVDRHGGSTTVRSDGLGRGSEFEVRMPLTAAVIETQNEPRATVDAEHTSKRVLIVDDSEDGAQSMAEYLRFHGHDTHIVLDGESALAVLAGKKFDVIVLDIGLPGLDGYDVARRIRLDDKTTRLIALTGWGQESDRLKSAAAGFDLHLVKPVSPRELAAAIASPAER